MPGEDRTAGAARAFACVRASGGGGSDRRTLLTLTSGGLVWACAARDATPKPFEIVLTELEEGLRTRTEHEGLPLELIRSGRTVVVTMLLCTHQGCVVAWDGQGYACPCHGGYYSAEGVPTAGPPRRRLRRLEVQVEGERAAVML